MYLFSVSEAAPVLCRGDARYTATIRDWLSTPLRRYVFSVREYGLKVLADLFAGRGHALKKCLFFRFALRGQALQIALRRLRAILLRRLTPKNRHF